MLTPSTDSFVLDCYEETDLHLPPVYLQKNEIESSDTIIHSQ